MLKRKLYTWVIKKVFFPSQQAHSSRKPGQNTQSKSSRENRPSILSPQLSSKRGSHLTTAYWPWSLFSLPVSTDVV